MNVETKKKTVIIVVGAIMSLGAIAWLASPILSEYIAKERAEIKKIEEQTAKQNEGEVHVEKRSDFASEEKERIKISDRMGQFAGQGGHQAKGDVVVDVREDGSTYLQFAENFDVVGGKGLTIYFGLEDAYDPDAAVGVLTSGTGVQEYLVPKNINPIRYSVIWLAQKDAKTGYAKASLQNRETHINPNNGIVPN